MTKFNITMHDDMITIKEQKEYFNGKLIIVKRYNESGNLTYYKRVKQYAIKIKHLVKSIVLEYQDNVKYVMKFLSDGTAIEYRYVSGVLRTANLITISRVQFNLDLCNSYK